MDCGVFSCWPRLYPSGICHVTMSERKSQDDCLVITKIIRIVKYSILRSVQFFVRGKAQVSVRVQKRQSIATFFPVFCFIFLPRTATTSLPCVLY